MSNFFTSLDTWEVEKKDKRKRPVVYPLFNSLVTEIKDPFWSSKLEKCALGKMPKKSFSFNPETNVFKFEKGKKICTLNLDPNNPQEGAKMLLDFFRKNGNIFSELDTNENNSDEGGGSKKILKWTNFRKIRKIIAILNFEKKLTQHLELTSEEEKNLTAVLLRGLEWKSFNKKTIILENNEISRIEGLKWSKKKRCFSIVNTLEEEFFQKEETIKEGKSNFWKGWKKFSGNLEEKEDRKEENSPPAKNHKQDENIISTAIKARILDKCILE